MHKYKIRIGLGVAITFVMMSFTLIREREIKVYLIGDSTMSLYPSKQFPMNGWGMPFANFFDSTVTIDNRAKGGRSTRTFIGENRWQSVTDSLKPGDYVLIQFGHNDEAKEERYKDRYTSPEDYRKNLQRFIQESRDKQAIPVLITPVSRLKFDSNGTALKTHEEYSKVVAEVSSRYNVPMIDLDTKSRELYQQMGRENSKWLFNKLEPGEHPNYPDGANDNTHFSEYGARRIAELVLAEIRTLNLDLKNRIVKPKK
ncbi:MAG: rhamnogalacturonan acetylesterase [Sphingobacteriaceae bacterium]